MPASLPRANSHGPLSIDSLELGDESVLERCIVRGLPAVLRGVGSRWRAAGRWTPAYLRTHCAENVVPVEYYPDGDRCGPWTYRWLRLGDYLNELDRAASPTLYLAEQPLAEVLPELAAEVELPPGVPNAALKKVVVFIGRGSFSTLHYHQDTQALLTQLFGEKELVLFPPQATGELYPESWASLPHNFSRIPLERAASLAGFPRYRPERGLAVRLQPGDSLFIPVHWWHSAAAPAWSLSVTHFWRARWREWRYPLPGLRELAYRPIGWGVRGLEWTSERFGQHARLVRALSRWGYFGRARRYDPYL